MSEKLTLRLVRFLGFTPDLSQQLRPKTVLSLGGETFILDPGYGVIVVYGTRDMKEELVRVDKEVWRIKERRTSGSSLFAAIGVASEGIREVRIDSLSRSKKVMVEDGEVTEADFR